MSSEQYEYRPLEASCTIRLLRILPDLVQGNIACTIEHFACDETPPYDALSYYWGSPEKTRLVHIRHASGEMQPQPLHENLWEFLDHMHAEKMFDCYLWTDFLCLDQTSRDEIQEQVPRMGQIYSRATRTISWLGRPSGAPTADADDEQSPENSLGRQIEWLVDWHAQHGEAVKAFFADKHPDWDVIRRNCQYGDSAGPKKELEPIQNVFPSSADLYPLKSAGVWFCMSAVLSRPYWTRVWVVQEVALACKVTIMFGAVSIPFDEVFLAYKIYVCVIRNKKQKNGAEFVEVTRSAAIEARHFAPRGTPAIEARHFAPRGTPMEELLRLGGRCSSSNVLDRVYGLLGLFQREKDSPSPSDGGYQGLNVDYDKTPAELSWDVIFSCNSGQDNLPVVMCTMEDMFSFCYDAETLKAFASSSRTTPAFKKAASVSLRVVAFYRATGWLLGQSLLSCFLPELGAPVQYQPGALEQLWEPLIALLLGSDNTTEASQDINSCAVAIGLLTVRRESNSGRTKRTGFRVRQTVTRRGEWRRMDAEERKTWSDRIDSALRCEVHIEEPWGVEYVNMRFQFQDGWRDVTWVLDIKELGCKFILWWNCEDGPRSIIPGRNPWCEDAIYTYNCCIIS